MHGRQSKGIQIKTRCLSRAVQRLTKTSRGDDGDLKYRAHHCHTLFVLQITHQAINLKTKKFFFSLLFPRRFQ